MSTLEWDRTLGNHHRLPARYAGFRAPLTVILYPSAYAARRRGPHVHLVVGVRGFYRPEESRQQRAFTFAF